MTTGGRPEKLDVLSLCTRHGLGGAPLNAGMLTKEFVRRGIAADLGFLFERDPDARHGTESFFVVAPGAPRSAGEVKQFLSGLVTQIVDRQPRAIIGFQPGANIVGALAARRIRGCRFIATQRNPSEAASRRMAHLDRILGSTPLYHGNIAVSEVVAESFADYPASYRRKLSVVHNGTPPLDSVDDDREACRRRFGMPAGRMVLGCLGRLHEQKNLSFALAVVAAMPDAELFIAGTGEEEASLRAEADKLGVSARVTFVGAVGGGDITRFYRGIDALLFPSRYEGFGRVLVEATSQGVPVVASDIPIVHEVGGDAVFARPFDVPAWVEAVETIAKDPGLVEMAVGRGYQQSAKFGLDAMVDGYLHVAGLLDCRTGHPAGS